ncbi:MAG: low molecular weight phosphatase family protein [Actinomycetota bacterium]
MTANQGRPRHAREHDGTFRVLVVCTGNLCRSPLAEQLLRARLLSGLPGLEESSIEVTSAGTMAVVGNRMQPAAMNEAKRLGVRDAEAHRARPLDRDQVERADLVVTMAREHSSAVVRMVPRAHHRTFTLVELTRIVESIADGRSPMPLDPIHDSGATPFLLQVVEAAEVRGLQPAQDRKGLDVEDPYRRSPAVYRRSANAVAEHVDRLVVALRSLAEDRALAAAGKGIAEPRA